MKRLRENQTELIKNKKLQEYESEASNLSDDPEDYIEEQELSNDKDSGEEEASSDENDEEFKSHNDKKRGQEKTGDALYKAPTREEVKHLSQTQELFKSNLFKLQIEEVVKEVSLDEKTRKKIEKTLFKFKEILDGITTKKDYSMSQFRQEMSEKGIIVPTCEQFSEKGRIIASNFQMAPVKAVYVVGSFLLHTLFKSHDGYTVDLAVEMPKSVFNEDDYLNQVYFEKRACYLSYLVSQFEHQSANGNTLYESVEFELLHKDPKRPIATFKIGKSVKIRMIPMISSDIFDIYELDPSKSCIELDQSQESNQSARHNTPRYNNSLLMDTCYLEHMNFLHLTCSKCPAFKDACLLGKLWLLQRGAYGKFMHMNGFLLSMFMAFVLSERVGQSSISSYQLFKLTIEFLSSHDFSQNAILPSKTTDKSWLTMFVSNFDITVLDPSGRVNLTAMITFEQMNYIQKQAKSTMQLLNSSESDHFKEIFLVKMSISNAVFDYCFQVDASRSTLAVINPDIVSHSLVISTETTRTIAEALGNRVTHVHSVQEACKAWAIGDQMPLKDKVLVYVNADASNCLRVLEYGPSPTDVDGSIKFKKFWGSDKVQMRRFKDSSILNAVLWECGSTFEEKSIMIASMIRHLLALHAKVPADAITGTDTCFKTCVKLLEHPATSQLETFKPVADAFSILKTLLRDLDLPLYLENIHIACANLRYTALHPVTTQDKCHEIPIILEFEKSSKWPDDLRAIEETKTAFYIKIAELINENFPDSIIVKIRDSKDRAVIITVNGFTFKCTIHNRRQGHLIDELESSDQTRELKQQYLLESRILPALSSRIYNISVEQPFVATTIRVFKRWVASQMLLIPEIAIEMLCIYALNNHNKQLGPIASITSGLVRLFHVLSQVDIINDCLVVEFQGLTDEARKQIQDSFMASRSTLANTSPDKINRALYIASEVDPQCLLWNHGNSLLIANRLKQLSRLALTVLDSGSKISFKKLFYQSYHGYDAILELKPLKSPLSIEETFQVSKNIPKNVQLIKRQQRLSNVDSKFIQCYLNHLESAFGSTCVFFYDKYSGNKIGILFKPFTKKPIKFKSLLGYSSTICPDGKVTFVYLNCNTEMVTANVYGILTEMYTVGTGLVESVLLEKQPAT